MFFIGAMKIAKNVSLSKYLTVHPAVHKSLLPRYHVACAYLSSLLAILLSCGFLLPWLTSHPKEAVERRGEEVIKNTKEGRRLVGESEKQALCLVFGYAFVFSPISLLTHLPSPVVCHLSDINLILNLFIFPYSLPFSVFCLPLSFQGNPIERSVIKRMVHSGRIDSRHIIKPKTNHSG